MSIKLWVHKEDHKIDTSLARLTKKKKERTQIKKNWKGNITTNITRNKKKIIRENYGQLYANKVDNLEERDKFLETYSLSKLSQEETDDLNWLITGSQMESKNKMKQ